eukprot:CAMPEP_0170554562 /NCGR_PEP_ID=MMETSP0211-20121228/12418_1 /TAXON_ID=311385 /ORGANISM="Pseudokeronopsis sp., Strain OXSARD2" /LENGTH=135 /DNA_ID=CAMNT_0010863715 /DNA_START=31 /DNA_END=435 /DNA_ORIENTATION=-
MLYERSIRTCYENSLEKLIQELDHVIFCSTDSIQKDFSEQDLTEEEFLHLAVDAILHKRMEKRILLKIKLVFNKETGEVQLSPPVSEWIQEMVGLITYNVDEISLVPCFQANEIGNARENSKVRIFEKNDEYIQT